MNYIEEFDKLKTKVLKYILYKKRTEQEVRQKFKLDSGELLDDVIEELKELGYIDDRVYIEKAVREYINLKNLSIKEIEFKLMSKGIKKTIIDDYIYNKREDLMQYEINSAINIINKKKSITEEIEMLNYLKKKGYMEESLKIAMEQKEE